MKNISIGYLSWKRYKIFDQTLKSHKDKGLFNIILPINRIIFFQEISERDKEIALKYNCKYIGNDKNIGISKGFAELVNECKTEYIIFCENDWFMLEDNLTCENVLTDCIKILENNKADIIKLRSIDNPGNPMFSKPKNIEEWKKQDCSKYPYKLESLNWVENPISYYGDYIKKWSGNYDWFITDERHQKWSNNIFISRTEFLKNKILPIIDKFKNLDKYTGLEKCLIDLEKINFTIAAGKGLFSHIDKILN